MTIRSVTGPDGWQSLRLEEVVVQEKGAIRRGPFGGAIKKEIFVPDGYKVYEQKNAIYDDFETGHYFIDESKYRELEGFSVKPGDLIVSCSGTIGRIAIVPANAKPGIINQALMRIRPNANLVLRSFFKRLLEWRVVQEQLFGTAAGSAIKNVKPLSEIRLVQLPIPPLPDQRRIAAILDKADAIRRNRRVAEQQTEQLFASAFVDTFGDPVTNPKRWDKVPLPEITKRITVGIVVKPASYYVTDGVPALRSLNVRTNRILTENLVYFSPTDNETALAKTRVWQDDVVLVRSGQPGTAAVVPEHLDGVNAIDILIVTPDLSQVTSQYLCHFFNSAAGKRLVLGEERGQIQKHLNVGSLRKLEVSLPPIAEQREFNKVLMRTASLKGHLAETLNSAEGLFNSLIQRAFRGEL